MAPSQSEPASTSALSERQYAVEQDSRRPGRHREERAGDGLASPAHRFAALIRSGLKKLKMETPLHFLLERVPFDNGTS